MDRKVLNTLEKLKNLKIDIANYELIEKQIIVLTNTRAMLNLIKENFPQVKVRMLIHFLIDMIGTINNKNTFPARYKEFANMCGMAFKNKNVVWKEFSDNPIEATKDFAYATLLSYIRYAVYTNPEKAYEKLCKEIVFLPQGVQLYLDWIRPEDFKAIYEMYERFCNVYPDYPHLFRMIENKVCPDAKFILIEGEYINEHEETILRRFFRDKMAIYRIGINREIIKKRIRTLKAGNLDCLLNEKSGKVIGIFAGELISLADWFVKHGKQVKTLFMKEVVHEGMMRFVFFVKKMHNPDAILKEKDIRYFLKYLKDEYRIKLMPYLKVLKKANNIPVKIFTQHKAGEIAYELATIPIEELIEDKYLSLYQKYAMYYDMIYTSYQDNEEYFELIPFWQYKPATQEKLYILGENTIEYQHEFISYHLQDILTSCSDDSILISDGIYNQRPEKEAGF